MTDSAALFCEALTKAALYLSLQCVVGAAAAYWLARSCGVIGTPSSAAIPRRLRRVAPWTAAALVLATAARAVAHTAAAFGGVDADSLRTIALESRWGHSWRIQMTVSAIVYVAAFLLRRTPRIGWPIYSVVALIYCACVPLVGHGAGSPGRIALHGFHVAAGAIWIGTLAMLAMLVLSRSSSDPAAVHRMVAAFSAIALPSAAILVATGTIASVLYLHQIAHIWDTVYGRVLLAKLALVGVVAALGRRNWLRGRRGDAPDFRVMMFELSAAVLVVLFTGVLTELEHP